MLAYVTGATGCVGRNLIDTLLQHNCDVVVLHRKSSDLSKLHGCDVKYIEVDLHNLQSTNIALARGGDAVFHVAANVQHSKRHNDQQWLDNVVGTTNLVESCLRAHIGRFIFTSTGAAGMCDGMTMNEMIQYRRKSNYAVTKKLSEVAVQNGILRGLDAVILRIPIVVGKYDYNNYSQIFNLLQKRKLKASIAGHLTFGNATDIANAHLSAYEHGHLGSTYYLGGEFTTWHDLCVRASWLLGVKPPMKPLPLCFYHGLARWLAIVSYFTGKEPLITPELVHLMSTTSTDFVTPAEYSRTENELGYVSSPLSQSLVECYQWLLLNKGMKT